MHIYTAVPEQRDRLIGVLSEEGFSGFEEKETELVAFIPEEEFPARAGTLDRLSRDQVPFSVELIPAVNWNALWENSFSPVKVGRFCAVRAAFHPPVNDVKYDIIITPRMTFGTGHHATTASMIRLMEPLDLTGKSVFDFGTGTGILAILAAKMGAGKVVAMDRDAAAVENAKANALENRAEGITFVYGDEPDPACGPFDCILVNIQLQVILSALGVLTGMLLKGGALLLSGVLEAHKAQLSGGLTSLPYEGAELLEKEGWLAGRWAKK